MAATAEIASFKLRFVDDHVRIRPVGTEAGVDLRGEPARACFALARPMLDWLLARQPGVALRALSVDLRSRRVLVSFEDAHAVGQQSRPIVLRIEAADSGELLDLAAPLLLRLRAVTEAALARRGRSGAGPA